MNDKTIESLSKIRKLVLKQEQTKRFVKVSETCKTYQLDKKVIMENAKKCGALYKIRSITLVDIKAFESYFEKKFKVGRIEEKGAYL